MLHRARGHSRDTLSLPTVRLFPTADRRRRLGSHQLRLRTSRIPPRTSSASSFKSERCRSLRDRALFHQRLQRSSRLPSTLSLRHSLVRIRVSPPLPLVKRGLPRYLEHLLEGGRWGLRLPPRLVERGAGHEDRSLVPVWAT